MKNDFYVYEWYNVDTDEVFYVGKGRNDRYKNTTERNNYFKNYYSKYNCNVRKVKENLEEQTAFDLEKELIKQYREIGQCKCNLTDGGEGASFPEGSWDDLYNKLKILNYGIWCAMDDMDNEEEYDYKNLKTKSLEELQKLYNDYYDFKEKRERYEEYKEICRPFNSLPADINELDSFEVKTMNKEIEIFTDMVANNIIKNNSEFSELLQCKTELDYMLLDMDIDDFLSKMLKNITYYESLKTAILASLWWLKRIRYDLYIQIRSFNIKNNTISIKFSTKDNKKKNRIKVDLRNIVLGLIIFKNKTLCEIILEEIMVAPFI